MRKLVLIAHTSLDGYVAGLQGELTGFAAGDENLGFVCDLAEQADAALFGRVSYQLLESYWPTAHQRPHATENEIRYANWYNAATKIVLSASLPATGLDNTIVIAENVADKITQLKQQPGKDILIFGSPSATQVLMKYGLIDSYWIFVNPVLFGQGIPLFTANKDHTALQLVRTKQFSNGELALLYSLKM